MGIIFALFPYDYPLLWSPTTNPPPPASYLDFAEAHLRFLHSSPPLIPRLLHIVIAAALAGFAVKLARPSESNVLFDGASLVLFMCGVVVYVANIVTGLRAVSAGAYRRVEDVVVASGGGGSGATSSATAAAAAAADPANAGVAAAAGPSSAAAAVGSGLMSREDSLKVLAASNTILGLVLVGVLVLQAGQWYADRKEQQEVDAMRVQEERERRDGAKGTANGPQGTRGNGGADGDADADGDGDDGTDDGRAGAGLRDGGLVGQADGEANGSARKRQ